MPRCIVQTYAEQLISDSLVSEGYNLDIITKKTPHKTFYLNLVMFMYSLFIHILKSTKTFILTTSGQ